MEISILVEAKAIVSACLAPGAHYALVIRFVQDSNDESCIDLSALYGSKERPKSSAVLQVVRMDLKVSLD